MRLRMNLEKGATFDVEGRSRVHASSPDAAPRARPGPAAPAPRARRVWAVAWRPCGASVQRDIGRNPIVEKM